MTESLLDVPSPVDLRCVEDAATWAVEAMAKRPYRARFFEAICDDLRQRGARRVLELGSGPGFLARRLLETLPSLRLTLLDFSDAMHALARERLGSLASEVRFVTRDLREQSWCEGLLDFDAVVTVQAVHELRHKLRAVALHATARGCLAEQGAYLVCDHYAGAGGMLNHALYMTVEEQAAALDIAGFSRVERVLQEGSLILHRALV